MKFNLAEMLREIERDTRQPRKAGTGKLTQAQIRELLARRRRQAPAAGKPQ